MVKIYASTDNPFDKFVDKNLWVRIDNHYSTVFVKILKKHGRLYTYNCAPVGAWIEGYYTISELKDVMKHTIDGRLDDVDLYRPIEVYTDLEFRDLINITEDYWGSEAD